ncbi:MAG: sigma 54-interacting transcriptional regulator [Proteobacteria bacterium]|nr:sigma 54-interacting transcriptional regulator [Pseudomonadota bacterium]MBU1450689.1 sigma 54-interacting transcriptional regulator [Pseudomonadota bacterium]MBU2468628.1 sigma 54-interacting transcriptional regulator [Pseudomonadota bacterium]
MAGQLVMDAGGAISAWDQGMESLTGLRAASVLGSPLPPSVLDRGHPLLADYLRRDDEAGAREVLGPESLVLLAATDHWVAHGRFDGPGGETLAFTELACRHGEDGSVLETVFAAPGGGSAEDSAYSALNSLRILAEHVPAGVALIQDGLLIMVNQTFCTMFGYTHPSELADKPASLLLAEGDRIRHKQILQTLDKNQKDPVRFRWTGIDKNGRKFWFEGRPAPIDWVGRPATLSTVMDITEFKQREELIEKESQELRVENLRLKTSIDYRVRLGNIIGRSRKMQEVFEAILRAASSDYGIVIYGETGTGKELVAKAVHELSQRNEGPFVAVNCGAIPEELFEAEFFGHRKGSFTGAHADKPGFLDQAKGGTLFLDEVAELSYTSQVKLLRALGSGEYTAIGSPKSTQADFRVISASNRDLEGMVRSGDFRQDLFYRIHVIPIPLPPLRERKEDIPFLVEFFLEDKLGAANKMASYEMAKLLSYDWPGNVRELRNTLERYMAFGNLDFMPAGTDQAQVPNDSSQASEESDLRTVLMQAEKQIIVRSLIKYNWNRSHTAAALGLPRKTLFRKMKKLGIAEGADTD